MNLETGVFTSLTSGHYTLTLSGYSALDARQLNLTILTKIYHFDQILQYQPNLTISTKFHNFAQTFHYTLDYNLWLLCS